jgi:hypothetical protein
MNAPTEVTSTTPPKRTLSAWIGHIITIVAAGTAGGVGYGTIESKIVDLDARVGRLENDIVQEIREVKSDITDVRVRIAEMGNDLRWLKDNNK